VSTGPFYSAWFHSTFNKFIFSCAVPSAPPEEMWKYWPQREAYRRYFKTWGEVVGVDMTLSDIADGGLRLDVEAKTDEAKTTMWKKGFLGINHLAIEIRRLTDADITVTVLMEFPNSLKRALLAKPDPNSEDTTQMRMTIEHVFGIPAGKCRLI